MKIPVKKGSYRELDIPFDQHYYLSTRVIFEAGEEKVSQLFYVHKRVDQLVHKELLRITPAPVEADGGLIPAVVYEELQYELMHQIPGLFMAFFNS